MIIDVLTSSQRILHFLAKSGEASVRDTVDSAGSKSKDHMAAYPLALLVEAGFVGLTFEPALPPGAETKMREFGVARHLHILMIEPDEDGIVRYENITSSGAMTADTEKAYLKANGYLYLIQTENQRKERFVAFCIGIISSTIIFVITNIVIGGILIEMLNNK